MAEQVPAILEGQDMSFLEMQGDAPPIPVEQSEEDMLLGQGMQQLNDVMIHVISRYEGGVEEIISLIENDKEAIKSFKDSDKKYDGMLDDLDLPEGDESNVASFVASSVPGGSLTGDLQDNEKGTLGKYPWETPPEMASMTEAFDFILNQKDTSSNKTNMTKLMYAGVPAESLARTITFRGFLEGLWTPDIEELLVIPVIFELVADAQDEGITSRIFNDFSDDAISEETVLDVMENLNPEEFQSLKSQADFESRMPVMTEPEEPVMGSFLDMEGE
tara:strand:- start:12 stop:836 length:825 start_codon:yes stop_codon:yes gene_type:complete